VLEFARAVLAMLDVTKSSSLASSLARARIMAQDLCVPRASEFSKGQIALLFALLMAIASIPILLHPLPPISDYINHLARMHVIATINSDPDLSRYYEIDWQVIPNLMMDLIVPLFERLMNVYLAGQAYTLLSFALILSGTVALHRELFGRWSAVPLIAFPMLYNGVFLVGTMNYVFGIGLVLWALVAWIGLRERSSVLRLSVSSLFVLGLFFCHLFALGVYALGLLAFEMRRLWVSYFGLRRSLGRDTARRTLPMLALDFVVTGLPFLPVPLLLMLSPTRGLWNFDWQLTGKVTGVAFVIEVYSHEVAFLLTVVVACAAGWALHRRALSLHAFGLVLLGIGAITYMALPRVMFDTYMVDQRLPISLAFILVACIDFDFRNRIVRWVFASGLVLFLAIRVGEVESAWAKLSPSTDSFRKSVALLQRGAKVLVAYEDPDGGDSVEDYGLMHADCIAIIERSALVTTAFTVVGKQVMHARLPYRDRVDTQDGTPPVVGKLVKVADHDDTNPDDYWRHWTTDYDYLYVLFTDEDSENPDPTRLTEIFAGDRFALYRIEKSQATTTTASKEAK
jgi:hypothetical protein